MGITMTVLDDVTVALKDLADRANSFHSDVDRRLDGFEKRLNRSELPNAGVNTSPNNPREAKLRRDAFTSFIRRGRESLTPEFMASLIVSDDSKGGYLAPFEFVKEIIKNLVLYSPIRALASVGQTSAGAVRIPKRTG